MTATTSTPRQAEGQGRPRPPPDSNTSESDRLRRDIRKVRYEWERAQRMGDERQAMIFLCQMNTYEAALRKLEMPGPKVVSLVPSPAPAGTICVVRRRPASPQANTQKLSSKQVQGPRPYASRRDPRRLVAGAERQRLKAGRKGKQAKGEGR